jgi:predicted transcriptional regulator
MVELGLLEESGEMRFKTTEKGRAFLSHYQNMARLLAGLNDVKNKHFVPHQGK